MLKYTNIKVHGKINTKEAILIHIFRIITEPRMRYCVICGINVKRFEVERRYIIINVQYADKL
jgi:hypothetical protein